MVWSNLFGRPVSTINDFLYYADGELVGYLTLNDTDPILNELIGIVHPAYRRRGIFRQLLRAVQEEHHRPDEKQLLLTCEQTSQSGQSFIQTIGAKHVVTEYEMVCTTLQERRAFDEHLSMRKAESSDLETIIKIQSASFGYPEDLTRQRVLHHAQDPRHLYYLLVYGEEPVGSLRLDHGEEAIGIFAVSVHPDYQSRRYGRQMLEEAIGIIRSYSQKPIFLYVNIENVRAVSLYGSAGFVTRTIYDYYSMI
jgi:ribosomal protein S18 acetylase RimI-like enzyme